MVFVLTKTCDLSNIVAFSQPKRLKNPSPVNILCNKKSLMIICNDFIGKIIVVDDKDEKIF